MAVGALPRQGITTQPPVASDPLPGYLRGRVLLVVAVVLAALSLLIARSPTYDVWAWLVWGREIAHLDLDTTTGPAWKPLPIAITALLSPAGSATPALWLVIARAGGLLALGGAARLGYRAAGPLAAVGAAGSLITVNLWLGYQLPYGMSEPILAALALWAAERYLQDRPAQAWWLLVAAALLRPEIWPFLIAFAAWLAYRRQVPAPVLAAGLVLVPLAWFVPQWFGDGNPFRLGQGQVAPNGPLDQSHPGFASLREVPADLLLWTQVGAVVGVGYAIVARDRLLLGIAAAGVAWAALIAVMAELHLSSGVSRYLVITQAAAAVLAGVGWVALGRYARDQLTRRGAADRMAIALPGRVCVAVAAAAVPTVLRQLRPLAHDVRHQQGLEVALPRAVGAAGGRSALLACGRPWVDPLQVTFAAWQLHLHISAVRAVALPGLPLESYRGPMLQTRDRIEDPLSPMPFTFFTWHQTGEATADGATWTVLSPCGAAS
ncbi:MAG: hypothetical protein ACQSGP_24440 [Frankia sp.]